jgi:hypothetical protein
MQGRTREKRKASRFTVKFLRIWFRQMFANTEKMPWPTSDGLHAMDALLAWPTTGWVIIKNSRALSPAFSGSRPMRNTLALHAPTPRSMFDLHNFLSISWIHKMAFPPHSWNHISATNHGHLVQRNHHRSSSKQWCLTMVLASSLYSPHVDRTLWWTHRHRYSF